VEGATAPSQLPVAAAMQLLLLGLGPVEVGLTFAVLPGATIKLSKRTLYSVLVLSGAGYD